VRPGVVALVHRVDRGRPPRAAALMKGPARA
jgi:hypothetical protein